MRSRFANKLLLGSALLVLGVASPARAVLVDGVAGTYGNNVLTVQDAYFYRAVLRFLAKEDPFKLEQGPELRRTVQRVLFEEIVSAEAGELPDLAAARTETGRDFDARVRSGGRGELQQILAFYQRTEAQARSVLARYAAVEKFLQKKLETLTPQVTDIAVDRYLETRKEPAPAPAQVAQVRERTRRMLRQERMQQGFEEWARSLRNKYRATNLLGGAPTP